MSNSNAQPPFEGPPLPKPDRRGYVPAVEYSRVSIARELIARRRKAGFSVEELARKAKVSVQTLQRHSSREAPRFASFCRARLRPLVKEFFALATASLEDDEKLHALRIAGKRLRYALELAPAAMQARVHQQLYSGLDEVQDRLGEVVDQLAAIDHVREWLDDAGKKRDRRRLRELLCREEQLLAQLRAKLLRWWSPARLARLRRQWQTALPVA